VSTTTSVQGADTFARTLREFGDQITELTAAHTAAGELIVQATRARSRRRSGALAGSFTARVSADGVTVGSALIYAPPQEFGWRRRGITPSRALTGALEESGTRIGDIYHDEVAQAASHIKGV
jgi:hypothetical protein